MKSQLLECVQLLVIVTCFSLFCVFCRSVLQKCFAEVFAGPAVQLGFQYYLSDLSELDFLVVFRVRLCVFHILVYAYLDLGPLVCFIGPRPRLLQEYAS